MNGDEREQRTTYFTALLGRGLPEGQYAHVWHLAGKHTDWVRGADAAEASARRNGRHDVYFGVSVAPKASAGERVKIETARGLLGVGADIDIAGELHKQQDLPPDEAAALALLDELQMPATLVVQSGHGLHVWWLFDEPWLFGDGERERAINLCADWQAHINAIAGAHGWKLDNVGDLARVLRVPGTINAKDPADKVPVRLLMHDDSARYTPDKLRAFLDGQGATGSHREHASPHDAVKPEQRFTEARPCPICGGHYGLPDGQGIRCWGFLSADGATAFCTREEYANGRPPLRTSIGTVYVHWLRAPGGHAWNAIGNAQRLLDAGGRDYLRYVPGRQFPWQLWDGNCLAQDREQHVARWMEHVLKAAWAATWTSGQPRAAQTDEARFLLRSGDTNNINGALAAVSRHVSVTPEVFDTHEWYVPCNNGLTYDFETGRVIPSLPEHRMTKCVPVPALTSPQPHPKFDAMLALVTDNNPEMAAYLLRLFGLCATGYVGEKAFWFWQGDTNAGKTTVLDFLARLLGPFAYAIPLKALLLRKQETGILHDIAGMRGMRLVYAEEFKPGDVLDSALIKKLTGQGAITADRKGEPNETFVATAKIIIGTNEMPALTDVDAAISERVRVVKFPVDIPKALGKPKGELPPAAAIVEDLMSEAPAILYDMAQAVSAWRTAHVSFGMPASVYEASKDYLHAQDPMVPWMETCCVVSGETEELPFATWYWSFIEQSEQDPKYASKKWFGTRLESHKFVKRVAYNGKFYTGPRLTDPAKRAAEDRAWREGLKDGSQTYDDHAHVQRGQINL